MRKIILCFSSVYFLICSGWVTGQQPNFPNQPNFPGAFAPAGWNFSIGGGALVTPAYSGSDDFKVRVLPYFSAKYGDRFSLDGREGLRYNFVVSPSSSGVLKLGVGAGLNFGRDEDVSDDLAGLGDIDPTVEAKVYADYRFKYGSLGVTFAQDVTDQHGGFTVNSRLATGFPIPSQDIFVSPSVGLTFGSEKYNQSFYGVNSAQSASSGLAVYQPEAGLNDASLNLLVAKKFNQNWSMAALGSYKYLLGDAAESPIVKDRSLWSGGLFLSYSF